MDPSMIRISPMAANCVRRPKSTPNAPAHSAIPRNRIKPLPLSMSLLRVSGSVACFHPLVKKTNPIMRRKRSSASSVKLARAGRVIRASYREQSEERYQGNLLSPFREGQNSLLQMRELALGEPVLDSESTVTDPRGHLVRCVDWMQNPALAIPLNLAGDQSTRA